MSTVLEIESAIRALPEQDFWKLAEWFDEARADAWDARIEADAKAGRLDALWQTAQQEISTGQTTPLDAFLDHQKLPR